MDKHKPLLSRPNWLLWIPLLISTAVLGVYVWNFIQQPLSDDAAKWGTFGDYFGGLLNPVIAACTLFVATGVWQLQKTELKATQKALEEQAQTAEQQRAEQRFFDLMNFYHQMLNSFQDIDRMKQGVFTTGKASLVNLLKLAANENLSSQQGPHNVDRPFPQNMCALLQDTGILAKSYSPADPSETHRKFSELKNCWSDSPISRDLRHYFRVVHRILTDAKDILKDDHFRFIRLFRAQLSEVELILLGLNLWASPEGEKMQTIASEYGLLKHLPEGEFRTILESELPAEVFGRTFAASKRPSSDNPPC